MIFEESSDIKLNYKTIYILNIL